VSLDYLSWAFGLDEKPTGKLVLLALADHANENGESYPSMKRLEQRTGLTRRSIQQTLRKLEEKGLVNTLEQRKSGRQVVSRYRLLRKSESSAVGANVVQGGGERHSPPGANVVRPSKENHHKEPSREQKESGIQFSGFLPPELLDYVPFVAVWREFVEERRERKKPLTERSAARFAAKFRGHSPEDVTKLVSTAVERGWQGMEWSWLESQRPNHSAEVEIPPYWQKVGGAAS